MGNPKFFYIWGKNVEKILATSCIRFQTGVAVPRSEETSSQNEIVVSKNRIRAQTRLSLESPALNR